MSETRLVNVLAAAVSTFAVGFLFTAGFALVLRAAHVEIDVGTSWAIPAAGCSAAAAYLFGRSSPDSAAPDARTALSERGPAPVASLQAFVGPVDYKLPHDAFRAAARRVTKLAIYHDAAADAGTETAEFASGYKRAREDLDRAILEEHERLVKGGSTD